MHHVEKQLITHNFEKATEAFFCDRLESIKKEKKYTKFSTFITQYGQGQYVSTLNRKLLTLDEAIFLLSFFSDKRLHINIATNRPDKLDDSFEYHLTLMSIYLEKGGLKEQLKPFMNDNEFLKIINNDTSLIIGLKYFKSFSKLCNL